MVKRFEVRDLQGRLWAKTMTMMKAIRIVEMLYRTKGVTAQIVRLPR